MGVVLNSTNLNPCKQIQVGLAQTFGTLPSQSNKPFLGGYDALTSPLNRVGVRISDLVNNGHEQPTGSSVRKVQLQYTAPECETDCITGSDECNIIGGSEIPFKFANIEVGKECGFAITLKDKDFYDNFCQPTLDTYVLDMFETRAKNIQKKIEAEILIALNSFMSEYSDGTSSLASPITMPFTAPDGTPNIGAFTNILSAYMKRGYTDSPLWVSGAFAGLKTIMPFLGTNQNGVNLSNLDLSRVFYSNLLDPTINPSEQAVLTFLPGTFQFVEYYDYKRRNVSTPGIVNFNGKSIATFTKQTTVMNVAGWDWDVIYVYDCGQHTWNFTKKYDIIQMPTDAVCINTYPALKFLNGCIDPITCGSITDCSQI